jgi:hypothetical protein
MLTVCVFRLASHGLELVEVVGDDRLGIEPDLARVRAEEAPDEQPARKTVEIVAFDGREEWNLDFRARRQVLDG